MIEDKYDRDYWTIAAMLTYGGSFVKQLAELAAHADSINLVKIKSTWPDYWEEYEKMGDEVKRKSAEESDLRKNRNGQIIS